MNGMLFVGVISTVKVCESIPQIQLHKSSKTYDFLGSSIVASLKASSDSKSKPARSRKLNRKIPRNVKKRLFRAQWHQLHTGCSHSRLLVREVRYDVSLFTLEDYEMTVLVYYYQYEIDYQDGCTLILV